jgi:FAD/FMN-containing dehydrogenase
LDRRDFLNTAAGAAGAALLGGWTRLAPTAEAASLGPRPPFFPPGIDLVREAFENWSGEVRLDDVWTARPTTIEQVLAIVDWAARHDWRVRPQGFRHNWCPIVVTPGSADGRSVIVDLTAGFTGMEMAGSDTVRVQAGASLESLLGFLEDRGLGFTSCPVPGNLTVGGMLAIGAHGTSVPASGEGVVSGRTYGSIPNRVVEMTVIAWNQRRRRYVVRTVDRRDPEAAALLVALGRTFIIDVVLRAEPNDNLRCESWTSISGAELFAPPGSGGRLFTDFLADAGRVEAIWYPFTANPWLKVWTIEPTKPFWAREVSSPYNYPFSDQLSDDAVAIFDDLVSGSPELAPTFGGIMYTTTVLGLSFNFAYDLWGKSKNLLQYIQPTTLRVSEGGCAVLTRRSNLQNVVHRFVEKYESMLDEYRDRGEYPINAPIEIRVTGVDRPEDCGVPGAQVPLLSPTRPAEDHPEWDVVLWLNLLTIPGTPGAGTFFAEMESWLFAEFNDGNARARVEWSKGWAFTDRGPYRSKRFIRESVPASLGTGFGEACRILDQLDPRGVFRAAFHDDLMPPTEYPQSTP